jgi:hypothetical protein
VEIKDNFIIKVKNENCGFDFASVGSSLCSIGAIR